jgi:glucose/mannose-6-phosphate isomerase
LITAADVERIDNRQVHKVYDNWPEHFRAAARINVKTDHDPDFYDSILLCGMGGSGTSCDVLNEILLSNSSKVHCGVLKSTHVPSNVDRKSLVMINSVSGNTIEAISTMYAAAEKNAEIICISAGGQIKELCAKLGCNHIEIPNLLLPRASLPYLIMPGLKLIDPFLRKSLAEEVSMIYDTLEKVARAISMEVPEHNNVAKKIATFLQDEFTFCFTSPSLLSAGTRFKNSLNENAKMSCLRESVLEASHNEIVPFTFNNKLSTKSIFLRWVGDSEIVKQRFDKIGSLFVSIEQPFMELFAYEKSLINAILSSIYILDYATIYLAISRGIDPSPTPAIDILKKT